MVTFYETTGYCLGFAIYSSTTGALLTSKAVMVATNTNLTTSYVSNGFGTTAYK
jgi:hypothetical protein